MNTAPRIDHYFFGEVVYNAGGTCGPRQQEKLQLVLLHRGSAEIRVGRREFQLRPGEVALMKPGREEFYQFDRQEATHHTWLDAFLAEPLGESFAYLLQAPDVLPISQRMEKLLTLGLSLEPAASPSQLEQHDCIGRAMLLDFIDRAGVAPGPSQPLPPSLQKALRFIRSRYSQPIHLEAIARSAAASPQHLSRLFRQHMGQTPVEHLWRVREDHGRRLLRETGLSIAEIAETCGFKTPYHFSRRIKDRYGLSPRELRRQAWAGAGPS